MTSEEAGSTSAAAPENSAADTGAAANASPAAPRRNRGRGRGRGKAQADSAAVDSTNATAPTEDDGESHLTWQQKLLTSGSGEKKTPRSKRRNDRQSGKEVAATTKQQPDNAASAMTWQQELFSKPQGSGASFDRPADARDVETFGAASGGRETNTGKSGGRRKGGRGRTARNLSLIHI